MIQAPFCLKSIGTNTSCLADILAGRRGYFNELKELSLLGHYEFCSGKQILQQIHIAGNRFLFTFFFS